MKKQKKSEFGITLVVLIVTIIILLILVGVAIAALTQTGLVEKAKQAKQIYENVQNNEISTLTNYDGKITGIIEGTTRDENLNLENSKLKLLTTVSENTKKNIGKYNMASFIKNETDNIQEFLEYDSNNNLYVVKKSEWYILDINVSSAQNENYPQISLNIFINNDKFFSVTVFPFNTSSDANSKSITLFLTTGNTISFEKEIVRFNNNNWNRCEASIFVMAK